MTTRQWSALVGTAALALLTACVPQQTAPVPVPPPPPRPVAPTPPPPPPPTPNLGWLDAPLAPGNWVLRGREAHYGPSGAPVFIIRCEGGRRISLIRPGADGNALTIRASNGERSLAAGAGPDGLTATVPAGEPILDAIAFSRGRFSVESQGAARLVVPAWPEPARVVDDCRR